MNRSLLEALALSTMAIIFALMFALVVGADEINTQPATIVTSDKSAIVAGNDAVLVGDVEQQPAILVSVQSDNETIDVKARRSLFELGDVRKISHGVYLITGPPGKYLIEAVTFGPGFERTEAVAEIAGDVQPDPDDETNVDPLPDGDGFNVLVVFEETTADDLPAEQFAILHSQRVRDYLRQHGANWRFLDKDTNPRFLPELFQNGLKEPRDQLPWLYVSNGVKGYSKPLPATIDETIEVLERFRPKGEQ